jgi:hypothetical protein
MVEGPRQPCPPAPAPADALNETPGRSGARDVTTTLPGRVLPAAKAGRDRLRLPLPVALYLLSVVTPVTLQLGPLYMTLTRAYLVLMFLPLLAMLFSGRAGKVTATDILLIGHGAWMAVALQANNPDQMITQVGSIVPDFLGGYLLARVYIRTPEQFMALARWMGILIACLLPFALYESRTGVPLIIQTIKKLPLVGSYSNVAAEKRLGLDRVQGVMVNPIHFGVLCSTAFSMTVVALSGVLSTKRRLLTGAAIGLSAFLSLSAGAFLALLMQILLLGWYWAFRRTGFPWLLLTGWAAFCYIVIDMLSNRAPIQVFFSYATFSPHTAYWRGLIFEWGMKNVWANPILGLGLNNWERPWFMFSGSMDNFWLLMAVRYGIPGFLFLAIGYGLVLWRVGRRKFDGDARMLLLRRAWMLTMVGLTFSLCTVHIWTTIHSYVFFLFGAGMWFLTATARPEGEGEAAPQAEAAPRGTQYTRFPQRPRD